MSDKRKILVQLDTDPSPSLFDRIVAIDAGAEEVVGYGGVRPEHVKRFVQDAIFTRGPKDLAHTAIFIGGNDDVQVRLCKDTEAVGLPACTAKAGTEGGSGVAKK